MTSDGTWLSVVRRWLADTDSRIAKRLDDLEVRALNLLADLWQQDKRDPMISAMERDMKLTRVLISGPETTVVTGTQSQIDAAAHRMSRRNRACVTISVIVGHYHRRGCQARPSGGLETEGN